MSTTPHDPDVEREIERTKREAARLASDAAKSAKDRGKETLDEAKRKAADRADEVASALESTAADLESSDGAMAGYGRSLAELMKRFAGGLRENDIEDFAAELAAFARRNPASFLAGSVALGFGVSRFLKATSARPIEDDYDDDFDDDETWLEGDEEELYAGRSEIESERWPEAPGPERPGAGSSSAHWAPTTESESPPEGRDLSAASESEGSGSGSEPLDPRDPYRGRTEP
ncbi:MAG: hypothetical protein C0P79_010375 [Gammaproteobacteria bacterium]